MGGMVTQQSITNVSYQRPSTLQDVAVVADNMRQEDIDECKAQSGDCPKGSMLYCYFKSDPCMTMISRNGYVMGMWGVVPETETAGRIWMLGCNRMVDDKKDREWFLEEGKRSLARIQKRYPVLVNVVDARNKVHVRWIRWMGFTFIRKHPQWGPEGRLFYEFVRI